MAENSCFQQLFWYISGSKPHRVRLFTFLESPCQTPLFDTMKPQKYDEKIFTFTSGFPHENMAVAMSGELEQRKKKCS